MAVTELPADAPDDDPAPDGTEMADIERAGSASAGLEVREEGGALVLYLSGDLDVTNAENVRSAINAALSGRSKQVIFDLAGLQFMDSSGIALIVSVARQVHEVQVRNPSTIVRRLIELAGLAEAFHMAPLAPVPPMARPPRWEPGRPRRPARAAPRG